jgi:hypothetical protein
MTPETPIPDQLGTTLTAARDELDAMKTILDRMRRKIDQLEAYLIDLAESGDLERLRRSSPEEERAAQ